MAIEAFLQSFLPAPRLVSLHPSPTTRVSSDKPIQSSRWNWKASRDILLRRMSCKKRGEINLKINLKNKFKNKFNGFMGSRRNSLKTMPSDASTYIHIYIYTRA